MEFEELNKRFPFLTCGRYMDNDMIGIIQNTDHQFISMYVYTKIPTVELKKEFLRLGEVWWWESNRKIPINMFLRTEFKKFGPSLQTFVSKEFEYILGPKVSIDNLMTRRVKRRSVQLIRRLK